MSRTVWKFPIPYDDEFTVKLPVDAKIVHLDSQLSGLYMWAIITDETTYIKDRSFYLRGTGHYIPEDAEYVGTIMDNPMVWHIFEKKSD